jgi:hypothetical protein
VALGILAGTSYLTGVTASLGAEAFDWSDYGRVLAAHVKGGRVDYATLKARDSAALEEIYTRIGKAAVEKAPRDEQLAFYINAYNAIVLRGAAKKYPTKSIKDALFTFFLANHTVAGRKLDLSKLEKEVIIKQFKEPRIHFAINCASASCPPLLDRPFTAAGLEGELETMTRAFLGNPANVTFDGKKGELKLSKIFDWYKDDFTGKAGTVEKFIEPYLPDAQKKLLASRQWKIAHYEYDWSLNDAKSK